MHRSPRLLAYLVLMLLAPAAALAQDAAASATTQPAPRDGGVELTPAPAPVQVKEPAQDEQIAARLRNILETTNRFSGLAIRVENGVVFLSGRTRDAEHRAWATELARKTQDVVAVVNNITIREPDTWDLSPAWTEMRALWRAIVQGTPLVLIGAVVFFLVLLIAHPLGRLLGRVATRGYESDILRDIAQRVFFILILLIGLYLFLRISGLTQIAVTVLGGTGVAGLVFGFAFRDIAENFLASILISLQRPFRIGDTIDVGGQVGIVQKVTTRGTVLMDFSGNYIQLSNSTVYKSTLKNLTANPRLRADFAIGLAYEAAIPAAQEVISRVLQDHSAVLKDPEPLVLCEDFTATAIQVRAYFWIDVHKHSLGKVKSAVMRLTLSALRQAGVPVATGVQTVVIPETVPVRIGRAGQPADARPQPPAPPPATGDERHPEATAAEGGLETEVHDLQQQAQRSELPEEGPDLLSARRHLSGAPPDATRK